MNRRLFILIAAIFLAGTAFAAGAILRPAWLARSWTNLTARSSWHRHNRLGTLLELGMKPQDVERVLGSPTSRDRLDAGARWRYWDGVSCGGNELLMEFADTACGPRLAYVHQDHETHAIGPHAEYYTLGQPLSP